MEKMMVKLSVESLKSAFHGADVTKHTTTGIKYTLLRYRVETPKWFASMSRETFTKHWMPGKSLAERQRKWNLMVGLWHNRTYEEKYTVRIGGLEEHQLIPEIKKILSKF